LRICSDILDKVKRNVLESENLWSFNAIDYKELLDFLREKVSHEIIKDQSYNLLMYPCPCRLNEPKIEANNFNCWPWLLAVGHSTK
jgi:hypothetical protein